mmetsp:Transcript_54004/g.96718  ORF Transcript_54004/g.96718 Transcript_54004/m.96718 type:complete len:232 (+) Transcript_54004:213-908(+)
MFSGVHQAALVSWNHVLNVDERILSSMQFKDLQSFVDELPLIQALALGVVYLVPQVEMLLLEDVEDRKDLPIVWHQGLSNHVGTENQSLKDLQHGAHQLRIASVESGLDRDDQLRNHGQDLGATLSQHVIRPLDSQESIWILLLSEAVKEDGQVVMVVQLLYVHFPGNLSSDSSVEDLDWQISSIIKFTELALSNGASIDGSSPGRDTGHRCWPCRATCKNVDICFRQTGV